jgi:toxin FitB
MEARLTGQSLAITFVTFGELTSWTLRRNWGARRLADLTAWRRHVVTLPFDDLVATTWGTLDARAQARGRPRPHQRHVGGGMLHCIWRATCDVQRQGLRGLR